MSILTTKTQSVDLPDRYLYSAASCDRGAQATPFLQGLLAAVQGLSGRSVGRCKLKWDYHQKHQPGLAWPVHDRPVYRRQNNRLIKSLPPYTEEATFTFFWPHSLLAPSYLPSLGHIGPFLSLWTVAIIA